MAPLFEFFDDFRLERMASLGKGIYLEDSELNHHGMFQEKEAHIQKNFLTNGPLNGEVLFIVTFFKNIFDIF